LRFSDSVATDKHDVLLGRRDGQEISTRHRLDAGVHLTSIHSGME
jgi:hypothetical protein